MSAQQSQTLERFLRISGHPDAAARDLRPFPKEGFREWWRNRPAPVNAGPPEVVQRAEAGPTPPQKEEGGPFGAAPSPEEPL